MTFWVLPHEIPEAQFLLLIPDPLIRMHALPGHLQLCLEDLSDDFFMLLKSIETLVYVRSHLTPCLSLLIRSVQALKISLNLQIHLLEKMRILSLLHELLLTSPVKMRDLVKLFLKGHCDLLFLVEPLLALIVNA